VQALKNSKDSDSKIWIYPDAVIVYGKNLFIPSLFSQQNLTLGRSFAATLYCIAYTILEQAAQLRRSTHYGRQFVICHNSPRSSIAALKLEIALQSLKNTDKMKAYLCLPWR